LRLSFGNCHSHYRGAEMTFRFALSLATCALLLGCRRSESQWTAAQRNEYASSCRSVAADFYNTDSVVKMRGSLDVRPICECSLAPTERLFPSFGHWRVAALEAAAPTRDHVTPGYGPFSYACNLSTGSSPAFANWCAEMDACADPERKRAADARARPQ
jgi:hypothetical protein